MVKVKCVRCHRPVKNSGHKQVLINKSAGRFKGFCDRCRTRKSQAKTVVIYPHECLNHLTIEDSVKHQECPERLIAICGPNGILRQQPFNDLRWIESTDEFTFKPADMAAVLRVHEADYVSSLEQKCLSEVKITDCI